MIFKENANESQVSSEGLMVEENADMNLTDINLTDKEHCTSYKFAKTQFDYA